MKGWPDHQHSLEYDVKPYFSVRDEITAVHNLLLKGDCITVPSSMHVDIPSPIHQGHFGIEHCKAKARSSIYWPGLSQEIIDFVSSCEIKCQEFRNYQSREPLLPDEVPNEPWSKVGTDLFHLKGKTYLIIVDYMSKFF